MKSGKFLPIILLLTLTGCVEPGVNNSVQNNEGTIEASSSSYYTERKAMVEDQIMARGVRDEKIVEAMMSVRRHLFVPEEYRDRAYGDHPLPIGEGQTISQPYIVAFMTQILDLERSDKVLEIGTGSGYQAAVLGKLSDHVYTIEINEELGSRAKALLKKLEYDNVKVKIGDGYKGWPEHAPFDAIIVTAAPTHIPEPLKEQLKEGGRMIIPVGEFYDQRLIYIEKVNNELKQKNEFPVRFVPLVDPEGKKY